MEHDSPKVSVIVPIVFNVRGDAENSYYRSLVFPQKLFDALVVGRSVVVAKENWVAQWVQKLELGLSCSYKDGDAKAKVLLGCRERRSALPAFAGRARVLHKHHYDWKIMEERLVKLYEELARK